MANKKDRVSINALERGVKEAADQNVVTIEWRGVEVNVRRRLSLVEMMDFVDGVVESCFSPVDSSYMPEVKDFAIRCGILEDYANFTLPKNVEKKYELVCACDAYEQIMSIVDRTQFESILCAIDEKIDHYRNSHIEEVKKQMDELYFTLEDLMQKLVNAFEGLDPVAVSDFVNAMQTGGIDESKVVEAIFAERQKQEEAKHNGDA